MAMRMKEKFVKYWNITNVVFSLSSILDPRIKMKSISFYFPLIYGTEHSPEEITEVSDILTSLYNEYATRSSMPSQPSSWNTKTSSKASGSALDGDKYAFETVDKAIDEFEIDEDCGDIVEPEPDPEPEVAATSVPILDIWEIDEDEEA
ncbi:hypothetical protein IFM89_004704 [Coptis chinensis]|uniref:hAT-like transposase RNase-H fold domain-containing protein n=1 Tax=Coptis chinensis TaxID=261450 RepID=A0A835GXJ5_9MAGN|nr:hypothetical protein IFM89_004704 [Coptis chinensis]